MSEVSIKQALRRYREKTAELLDDESFNVATARGKLSKSFDFTCFDKGVFKLVKVCYQTMPSKEFDDLLSYSDSQLSANTILQIDFWDKGKRKPFYRSKLFYNQPNQAIPPDLRKLVK